MKCKVTFNWKAGSFYLYFRWDTSDVVPASGRTKLSRLLRSLLFMHLFLPCFSPPDSFPWMFWYSTLWTARPFRNDRPTVAEPLCGGQTTAFLRPVSVEYLEFSLSYRKYRIFQRYSTILIDWSFWNSWAVSHTHRDENKKRLQIIPFVCDETW